MASSPRPPVQGILFDLGGTLDGEGEHWLNRFYLLYRQILPEVTWEELKRAFYVAEEACKAHPQAPRWNLAVLVEFHVAEQLAALGRRDREVGASLSSKFLRASQEALKRSREVLSRLAARYRLGVVTNGYGNAELILKEAGIAPWLAGVVDSALVGVRKPDPAIFELALGLLKLPPEKAAFVGDSYNQDIRPAKKVGLATVWLRNDAMNAPLPPDFAPGVADYEIRRLAEVEALRL